MVGFFFSFAFLKIALRRKKIELFFFIIVQSKGKADEEAEPMVDKKNGSRTTEVKEPQDQIAKGIQKTVYESDVLEERVLIEKIAMLMMCLVL